MRPGLDQEGSPTTGQNSPLSPRVPPLLPLSLPAQACSPPRTHGCRGHKPSLPPSSSAPGSQLSETQVLSKDVISSRALCQPPDPKRSFFSVFPCTGMLRRASSTGRGNAINWPETFSLGGAGQCDEDRNQSFTASTGE